MSTIKKLVIMLLIGLCIAAGLIILISGNNQPSRTVKADTGSPRGVAEAYFTYMNARDTDKMRSLYTERNKQPNVVWPSLKNLEYAKIISIKEINDKKIREGYSVYGPGSLIGVKDENFVMYQVKYETKDRFHRPQIFNKEITIMRKSSDSPWLIDEFGEL